ncbi:hypothetical protein BXQ17_04385 [Polaribacter sp. BM10]|uniref:hypothetical protein n=1 Tax=Polaribacter sp. BM10 TaxID=1529069 RepID=UPI00098A1106|nr:hypothetical protein [Polaribacter sp. BM10]AQS93366.1 hypothetical protein BXQ17_04385 [Polaribacter sp. BM10]
MSTYSIENSKDSILRPNSEFERRIILQYYLDNDIKINEIERGVLNECHVSEHESIGIIGCLLDDKSLLNSLRLVIGANNRSNFKLSTLSNYLLDSETLKKAVSYYFEENKYDSLNRKEQIIRREFNIVY